MARRILAHWRDMQLLGGLLLVPILLSLVLALLIPLMSKPNSSKAEAQVVPTPAPIDGERAYGYLTKLCAIGPRPAGSEANARQRKLVAQHFQAHGGQVREQMFRARDPISGEPVEMANLIGSWFPDRTERVILAAHYDTRPHPDMDRDPVKRQGPFLGANDGASGVALLMEIAHHLETSRTPWGVDLVLLDGEELVYGQTGEYFLGSKEFARTYKAARKKGGKSQAPHYVAGLVLDMIGDRDLDIAQEVYSTQFAPGLVREVWSVAAALNAPAFRNARGPEVMDDHLPLNGAGIPTIDLIDFTYPAWHTAADVPKQCSGASLAQVGQVVTAWLALPRSRSR